MLCTWSVQCSVYYYCMYMLQDLLECVCSQCYMTVVTSYYTGSLVNYKVTERAACPGILTYSQWFSADNRGLILCKECLKIGWQELTGDWWIKEFGLGTSKTPDLLFVLSPCRCCWLPVVLLSIVMYPEVLSLFCWGSACLSVPKLLLCCAQVLFAIVKYPDELTP